jgi:hypothetical protein
LVRAGNPEAALDLRQISAGSDFYSLAPFWLQ